MSSVSVASLLHLRSETNISCPDFKGQNYKASFNTKSSAKGPRKKIYRAHLEGDGPRKGEHAVVKLFRSAPGTEAMCDAEITKHVMARKFSRKFNKMVTEQADKVSFTLPLKSTVEQFGIGAYLHRHSRHLDKQEWVLIEENLTHVAENDFAEAPKFCLFLRKNGERASKDPTSLDAFIHFSYIESGQKFVMCGFQGIHSDDKGYTLTTPCLHSASKLFGATDKGHSGIRTVFSKHKCNNLCYRWPKPSDHLDPDQDAPAAAGPADHVANEDEDEDGDGSCSSNDEELQIAHVDSVDSTVHFGHLTLEPAHSSSSSGESSSHGKDSSPSPSSSVVPLTNGHAKPFRPPDIADPEPSNPSPVSVSVTAAAD